MMKGLRTAGQTWLGKTIVAVLFGFLIVSFAIWGINDIFRGGQRVVVAQDRRRRDHRRPVPLQLPDRAAAAHPAHPSVGDAAAGPRHGPRQPDPVADGDRGDARPEGARARAAGVGSARRPQRHRGAELQGPERPVRPAAVRSLPRRARAVGGRASCASITAPSCAPSSPTRSPARCRSRSPPGRRSTATAPSGAPPPISSCRRPPPARSRRRATRSSRPSTTSARRLSARPSTGPSTSSRSPPRPSRRPRRCRTRTPASAMSASRPASARPSAAPSSRSSSRPQARPRPPSAGSRRAPPSRPWRRRRTSPKRTSSSAPSRSPR